LSLPVQPVKTGFENASLEAIDKFVAEHIPSVDKPRFPNIRGDVAHDTFAVLDSRSIRDGTVLLCNRYPRMPDEDLEEDECAWDEKKLIWELKEWRVKFLMAELLGGLLYIQPGSWYADFEVGRNMYFDENGVLQLPFFEHSEHDCPDLKPEERVPWGPDPKKDEK